MRKITQLFLVVLLMTLSMNNIKVDPIVKAQEQTEVVVDIEIDEDSELDVTFDKIYPFDENGLAKISNGYMFEGVFHPEKYGLLNNNGEILLNPIYDYVGDFNNDWILFQTYPTEENNYNQTFGLLSKEDGSIQLQNEYAYLDQVFGMDLFFAVKYVVDEEFQEKNGMDFKPVLEVKKRVNGVIHDVEIPEALVDDGIYQAYTQRLNNDYKILTIESHGKYTHSWIVDKFGNNILDGYNYGSMTEFVFLNNKYYIIHDQFYNLENIEVLKKGLFEVDLEGTPSYREVFAFEDDPLFNVNDIYSVEFFDGGYDIVRVGVGDDYSTQVYYFYDIKSGLFIDKPEVAVGPYEIREVEGVLKLVISENEEYLTNGTIEYNRVLNWYKLQGYNRIYYEDDDGVHYWDQTRIRFYDVNNGVITQEFTDVDIRSLVKNGLATVSIPTEHDYSLVGVIKSDGTYALDPIYKNISDFSSQGYAKVCIDLYVQKCSLMDSDFNLLFSPEYEIRQTFSESVWSNSNDAPLFDFDGHAQIYKFDEDINSVPQGLVSREGIVFDAIYNQVYFKNNLYYVHDLNPEFGFRYKIYDNDKNELYTFDNLNDYILYSLELVDNKYLIFVEGVNLLTGIYDLDGTILLDPEYTSIRYEDGKFYLEKYDSLTNSTVHGVIDENMDFVVPFENGYSSVTSYVGDYAIGQSGEKDNESPQLFTFFKSVKANSNEFKLDVLNNQGEVVGDLSEKFEFATLLSTDGENTTALVKKDGVFYLGHLVQTERVVDNPVDDDPEDEYEPEVIVDVDIKDFPKFSVTGLDDFEKLGIVLTEDEISNNVIVKLVLNTLPEEELSVADKKILNDFISKNTNLQGGKTLFLDISILKMIGELSSSINTLSSPITISFELPFAFWNTDFELLKVHDNKVESIKYDYNKTTHIITFSTDKFSTYALVEVMESEEEETPVKEEDSEITTPVVDEEKQTDEEQKKIPDTSDKSSRNVALLSLMFGLIFVFSSKKSGKKIT